MTKVNNNIRLASLHIPKTAGTAFPLAANAVHNQTRAKTAGPSGEVLNYIEEKNAQDRALYNKVLELKGREPGAYDLD